MMDDGMRQVGRERLVRMGCLYQCLRRNTYVEILVCQDSLRVPSAGFLPITFGDGTGLDQKATESEGIPRNSGGIQSLVGWKRFLFKVNVKDTDELYDTLKEMIAEEKEEN